MSRSTRYHSTTRCSQTRSIYIFRSHATFCTRREAATGCRTCENSRLHRVALKSTIGTNLAAISHLTVGLMTCVCIEHCHTTRSCSGVNTQNNVREMVTILSRRGCGCALKALDNQIHFDYNKLFFSQHSRGRNGRLFF